ncbi:MAG: Fe(3+) ABC transporter substrate-binding protein [Lentisphaeria bacterium]|nr:Fe(3+) ABC transporter substrate-binding protein [Lentisphaeria bacterium]
MKTVVKLIAFFAIFVVSANEVNVYSHRHYETDKKLFAAFEKETGIRVNVVKAKAGELIKRLELEGKNTNCDLFITADAGRIYRAKSKSLLQAVESKILDTVIPPHLKDKQNHWFGLTVRARVIVYVKGKVKAKDLSSYEALTDKKWKKKILIRKSDNIYNQSLLASIIAHSGEKAAREWAAGIVENMARKPKGNDRDQMKAIVAGQGSIAIVNTYYLGLLLNSPVKAEVAVGKKLAVFFPNQAGRGTHINISAAGVTKHAKNKANAVKLLEFLVNKESQKLYSEANYEYPVRTDVAPSALLKGWGDFKKDTMNLEKLGANNVDAVKIFGIVGWR